MSAHARAQGSRPAESDGQGQARRRDGTPSEIHGTIPLDVTEAAHVMSVGGSEIDHGGCREAVSQQNGQGAEKSGEEESEDARHPHAAAFLDASALKPGRFPRVERHAATLCSARSGGQEAIGMTEDLALITGA